MCNFRVPFPSQHETVTALGVAGAGGAEPREDHLRVDELRHGRERAAPALRGRAHAGSGEAQDLFFSVLMMCTQIRGVLNDGHPY